MRSRVLSLCSGYGGLEMGLELAGVDVDLVAYAEVDRYASKVMEAHHPGVPNLGDIKAIDWSNLALPPHASGRLGAHGPGCPGQARTLVGAGFGPGGRDGVRDSAEGVPVLGRGAGLASATRPIDILTAGYPCQPFSQAGKRLGTDDPRHLWPYVAEAIRHLRPGRVVLENVRGHLSKGFKEVIGELADIGYVGSWRCVRASDVGACHRRERVFIVARAADPGSPGLEGPQPEERHHLSAGGCGATADPGSSGAGWNAGGLPRAAEEGTECRADVHSPVDACSSVADPPRVARGVGNRDGKTSSHSTHVGLDRGGDPRDRWCGGPHHRESVDWGKFAPAIHRWEHILGRPAPQPTEGDGHRLNPVFVEWMMGLPAGHVTGVAGISRTQQLKILGNGVVPQQAAHAFNLMRTPPIGEVSFPSTTSRPIT